MSKRVHDAVGADTGVDPDGSVEPSPLKKHKPDNTVATNQWVDPRDREADEWWTLTSFWTRTDEERYLIFHTSPWFHTRVMLSDTLAGMPCPRGLLQCAFSVFNKRWITTTEDMTDYIADLHIMFYGYTSDGRCKKCYSTTPATLTWPSMDDCRCHHVEVGCPPVRAQNGLNPCQNRLMNPNNRRRDCPLINDDDRRKVLRLIIPSMIDRLVLLPRGVACPLFGTLVAEYAVHDNEIYGCWSRGHEASLNQWLISREY